MTSIRYMDDEAARRLVMRSALHDGVIADSIGDGFPPSHISSEFLLSLSEKFDDLGNQNTADRQNAGVNPKSLHYLDNSMGRYQHPEITSPYAEWTVELARFVVTRGSVGVVKGFEQYLAQDEEGQEPGFVYTQNSRWGIPGPWQTGLNNPITNPGIWHFRLSPLASGAHPAINQTGNVPLPGIAYSDFPQENLLWNPAGSASCNNVHFLVPSGFMLRLIYWTPVQSVRLEVAAKLRGWIQSDLSPESAINVRTNY